MMSHVSWPLAGKARGPSGGDVPQRRFPVVAEGGAAMTAEDPSSVRFSGASRIDPETQGPTFSP